MYVQKRHLVGKDHEVLTNCVTAMLLKTPCIKRSRSFTTEHEIKKHFRAMSTENDYSGKSSASAQQTEETMAHKADELVGANNMMLATYSDIRDGQRDIYEALGLANNDAKSSAEMAGWILQIASNYSLKTETVYTGLYLYYTYIAHVRKSGGGSFLPYKGRMVMNMRMDVTNINVRYEISKDFKSNMVREKNHLLIATTCLCMAAKMEESHFDMMVKPECIISDMRRIGHHLGRHKVFDFITVERDILEKLEWRLFRVHTPIPFLRMMCYHFAVCNADQVEAREILATCISSKEYVLTAPSEMAALCLISAMRKNNGAVIGMAKIAQFSCLTINHLVEHSCCILTLCRSVAFTGVDDDDDSIECVSDHSVGSGGLLQASRLCCLGSILHSKLRDSTVDEIEAL